MGSGAPRHSLTHQQHKRRATNHRDGSGEFAFVASTVGPCTAAGIFCQTQLLNAPLCHLQDDQDTCVERVLPLSLKVPQCSVN